MHTWALANQKGGTGKTTTAIHLAASLSTRGKRCLLIDLDPQAHATLGLGLAVEDGSSIAAAFLDRVPLTELVRTTGAGFHAVASEPRLGEFEEVAERSLQPERILTQALAELPARYDHVLLDCPPRADGVLTQNAVRAADTTLLVVETGAFALQGALAARAIFEEHMHPAGDPAARERHRALRIVATLYDPRERMSREFLIALQARFGDVLYDTVIRRDEVLREAVACGVPAPRLAPDSDAARDFDALAAELLGQDGPDEPGIPRAARSGEAGGAFASSVLTLPSTLD